MITETNTIGDGYSQTDSRESGGDRQPVLVDNNSNQKEPHVKLNDEDGES